MVIFNWYDKFIGDLAVDTIKLSSLPDRFPTCGTSVGFLITTWTHLLQRTVIWIIVIKFNLDVTN